MFDKLKTSEKILLGTLVAFIVIFLFSNILMPKYKEVNELELESKLLNQQIINAQQIDKIEDSDSTKTTEEKELDNQLLTYKNDYYIENFSQDNVILKLNDFLGENSSALDGFMIEKISFGKLDESQYVQPEPTETQTTDEQPDTSADDSDTSSDNSSDSDETSNDTNTSEAIDETVPTFQISELNSSAIDPSLLDYYTVSLDFVSNYDNLILYLNNLENYSDSIIVQSVSLTPVVANETVVTVGGDEEVASTNGFSYISSDGFLSDVPDSLFVENGTVHGNILMYFVDLKVYDENDNLEYTNPAFEDDAVLTTVENPFRPYSDFTHYEQAQTDASSSDGSNYFTGGAGGETVEQPARTYKTIYDFETSQYFFSSSPSSTNGTASLSPLSLNGNYSGKLTYNFKKGVETNTASYVFDTNSILISEKPSTVALKVYELTDFPYELGITVRDSAGKSYDVILERNENLESSWITYEGELPELTYPCIVKRVFVTTSDIEKTQLKGELLFDTLQVSKEND